MFLAHVSHEEIGAFLLSSPHFTKTASNEVSAVSLLLLSSLRLRFVKTAVREICAVSSPVYVVVMSSLHQNMFAQNLCSIPYLLPDRFPDTKPVMCL